MRVRWTHLIPPPPGSDEPGSYTLEGEVVGMRSGFLGFGTVLIVLTEHGLREVGASQVQVVK